jgi:hypothetical protein
VWRFLATTWDLRVAAGGASLCVCVCVCVCVYVRRLAYTEGRRDASAQPLPVFGVVAVCPLEQGGVEAEVVW